MMFTKTYPPIVRRVYDLLGRNCVNHHEPTETNPLGQSGLYTMIDDIMDIMEASPDPRTTCKDLFTYFKEGGL